MCGVDGRYYCCCWTRADSAVCSHAGYRRDRPRDVACVSAALLPGPRAGCSRTRTRTLTSTLACPAPLAPARESSIRKPHSCSQSPDSDSDSDSGLFFFPRRSPEIGGFTTRVRFPFLFLSTAHPVYTLISSNSASDPGRFVRCRRSRRSSRACPASRSSARTSSRSPPVRPSPCMHPSLPFLLLPRADYMLSPVLTICSLPSCVAQATTPKVRPTRADEYEDAYEH